MSDPTPTNTASTEATASLMSNLQKRLELLIPPPLIALATAGLMALVVPVIPAPAQLPPFHLLLCAVVAFAGFACGVAGLVSFWRHQTTFNPHSPQNTRELVVNGIYRHTRNPMYVGLLLMLAAWALYLSHFLPLVLLPVFVLYMNRFQVIPEERVLEEKFGERFDEYQRHVKRWI